MLGICVARWPLKIPPLMGKRRNRFKPEVISSWKMAVYTSSSCMLADSSVAKVLRKSGPTAWMHCFSPFVP
eukprot:6310752-Alexandrium_andersonii.AAC.1